VAEPVRSLLKILAAVAALNYTGVCGRQLKWMSADDYKVAAVGFFFDYDLKDRYSSVEEFLKENPDCCEIYRFSGRNTGNLIWGAFFNYRVSVKARYILVFEGREQSRESEYFVSCCGKVWHDRSI
jgi:hypothetical protein